MGRYSIIEKSIFRYLVILLLLILFIDMSLDSKAQLSTTDSLKLLKKNTDEQSNITKYMLLAKHYQNINLDSASYFGNKALELLLSTKTDNVNIIKQLMLLSAINNSKGDFNKSSLLLKQAEGLCIAESNYELLAMVKLDIAAKYHIIGNYAENLNFLNNALSIIEEYNIDHLKATIYYKLGTLYLDINDLEYANFFREKIFEDPKIYLNAIDSINGLLLEARILYKDTLFDSSYVYINKALVIAKRSNLSIEIQMVYRHIAMYWIAKKNYKEAISNVDISIEYCKKLDLLTELSSLLTYKAHIFSAIGDMNKTLEYNLQALKLRENSGNLMLTCASYLNIGGNYIELADYKQAEYYLKEGVRIASLLNYNMYLAYGYGKLSKLYTLQNDYETAFFFTKLNTQYNDSVLTSKTNNKVMFFKKQYELEKEKSISKSLADEIQIYLVIFLLIIIIISIAGIFFLSKANILRKKALVEIKKLSQVVETMRQAVLIIDIEGNITYVNNGFLEITNYPSANYIIGKSIYELINDDGIQQVKDEILPSLIKTGNWQGEIYNKRFDGSFIITEEACSIIKSRNGKIKYYVAIYNDITERKKDEAKLKLSRIKLKSAVETRDKIFSIIAHDLTGPFGSILGFSKIMATDFYDYQTEDHERFSRLIYDSSKTTFDLLTNLLHWSRVQLDSVELFIENVNLKLLVDENIKLLKVIISNQNITIHNNIPDNYTALIDNDTVSIVIKNLIMNAIKFSKPNSKVIITSNKSNDTINITVTDEGIGIKNERLTSLFDISVNNSEVGSIIDQKGSGLGLLLCKEFVKLNNGTISVKSEFGIGSDFTISFPFNNNIN